MLLKGVVAEWGSMEDTAMSLRLDLVQRLGSYR